MGQEDAAQTEADGALGTLDSVWLAASAQVWDAGAGYGRVRIGTSVLRLVQRLKIIICPDMIYGFIPTKY